MFVESYSVVSSRPLAQLRTGTRTAMPARYRGDLTAIPAALPCVNLYKKYPEKIRPMGNVVITDEAALQPWLLVSRRVSCEEAQKHGGCIVFTPSLSKEGHVEAGKVKPQYYRINTDDEVYGRAAYIPRPNKAVDVTRTTEQTKLIRQGSGKLNGSSWSIVGSGDSCTEEGDLIDTPLHSDIPHSISCNSYHCMYEDKIVRTAQDREKL